MKKTIAALLLSPLLILVTYSQASADGHLPPAKKMQVAEGLSKAEADKVINAGLTIFAFWNSGDEKYAKDILPENFIDRNLPEGRPPGLKGVLWASKGFRTAVPDLKCSVEEMYVMKGRVVGRLLFTGTFTGTFGEHKGKGQKISFQAVDIYNVGDDGKIIDGWHLEDYLTLFKQMGTVEMK
ncbi:MAG: ester cyclase [Hyphomicrobiaceae bacterium]